MSETALLDPPTRDCALCPRLAAFRGAQRTTHPDWFNAPVPSFGPDSAVLLIVGLAPGLRGANRTGRPFTGDYAGDLLYRSLLKFGLAAGDYAAHPQDGLILQRTRIANAVLAAKGLRRPTYPFGHGATHELPDGTVLADSYHCSRLNTNTGRLTPAMFEAVIAGLTQHLAG